MGWWVLIRVDLYFQATNTIHYRVSEKVAVVPVLRDFYNLPYLNTLTKFFRHFIWQIQYYWFAHFAVKIPKQEFSQ